MSDLFQKLKPYIKLAADMRIAVTCLAYSLFLTFIGTIAQVEQGLWNALDNYFNSWFAKVEFEVLPFPLFIPGAILLALVYTINLSAALIVSIKWKWSKLGLLFIHTSIILLGAGQLFTQEGAKEGQMRIPEGGYSNYSEDVRYAELAIIEHTDPKLDTVIAVPTELLRSKKVIDRDELPFNIEPVTFYRNAELYTREDAPELILADRGQGMNIGAKEIPKATKMNEIDVPTAALKLTRKNGGELGTWMVTRHPAIPAQTFRVEGRTFSVQIRAKRYYLPFTVRLLDFKHEKHPKTNVPSNFQSKIKLLDTADGVDRFVDISMNEPLRYKGQTLFQASFADNDTTSIFQVVDNPGWTIPYISCALISLGMLMQFISGMARMRGGKRDKATSLDSVPAAAFSWKQLILPALAVIIVGMVIGRSFKPAKYENQKVDVNGFMSLPVQHEGRLKPLTTLARTSFIAISGKQKLT